ncbi:MAG: hypothetical protein HW380_2104 [Magnetococcales bacterium]|nr:hypothetical protein [Magnetococcales bacterium]HIJ83068.1 class I SAM-dependent methyltransferase [Magnetococcales bacterium]
MIKKKIKNNLFLGFLYQAVYDLYYSAKRISTERVKRKFYYKYFKKWIISRKTTLAYRYGVDTEGVIYPEKLGITSQNIKNAVQYQKCNEELLVRLFNGDRMICENTVFVDLGSGKGLVLMLAAMKPFLKIIGIEFSEKLHFIAMQNLQKFFGLSHEVLCRNVISVYGDAADFPIPDDPVVVFMCNPFGEEVMKMVVSNLVARIQRSFHPVTVIYMVPRQKHVLAGCPLLEDISEDFFSTEMDRRMIEHISVWKGRTGPLVHGTSLGMT